jgi:hypothetical protein
MSELVSLASIASWSEPGAELPASRRGIGGEWEFEQERGNDRMDEEVRARSVNFKHQHLSVIKH